MCQRPKSPKHRRAIAKALRRWLRAQGFASLAEVKGARWQADSLRQGWPQEATPQQVRILDVLRHGPRTAAEIAIAADVRPSWWLATTLKTMAARGWVQLGWRRRVPGSGKGGKRRVVRLTATMLEAREQWEEARA